MDKNYFLQPTNPCQRKYEALRALFVDNLSPKEVSAKFGYSIHTIYSYQQEFNSGSEINFFLPLKKGPRGVLSKNPSLKGRIISLRKKNSSILEIQEILN